MTTLTPFDPISVAVEGCDPLGPLTMKGQAYRPDSMSEFLPAMWIVALPGGTYRATAYYDRQVPGFVSHAYSMARYFARHGIGFVTFDTLGTGDNTLAIHGEQLTRQLLGEVYAQLVTTIRHQIVNGTLVPRLLPIDAERLWVAGMGHSMGGSLLTEIQGVHAPFDATMILGWSQKSIAAPRVELERMVSQWKIEQGYLQGDEQFRRSLRPLFYSQEVPLALIQADERDACPVPIRLMEPLDVPGVLVQVAAGIQGPLYLGFGEVDICEDPRQEVSYYRQANPIMVAIQQGAAHCSNFSNQRLQMWETQVSWCRTTARQTKVPLDSYGSGSPPLQTSV